MWPLGVLWEVGPFVSVGSLAAGLILLVIVLRPESPKAKAVLSVNGMSNAFKKRLKQIGLGNPAGGEASTGSPRA